MAERPSSEWLVEEGIGEHRAIRLEGGTIAAARVDWPGALAAGLVEDALLISRTSGASRGTLRFTSGEEALIDGLPRDAGEGTRLRAIVTRAAIGEVGRLKRAQARLTSEHPSHAPTLAELLRREGHAVRIVRRFEQGDWNELLEEASSGHVAFTAGSLTVSATPAMTLIDIDGTLPPRALALAAVPVLARTIGRLDLAGSIGIDFPTLADKADRRFVDVALTAALAGWPHERTAMNGFGFVQLVTRLQRPSMLQRMHRDRPGASARALLRQAERLDGAGALLLTAHPAVLQAITSGWRDELSRRTGRDVRLQPMPALALSAAHAQLIAS